MPFPPSDHYNGTAFHNLEGSTRQFKDVLSWWVNRKRGPWPQKVPLVQEDVPPGRVFGTELRVSYVGHASWLIQTQGLNILTDPVWSQRIGPIRGFGLKRVTPPGIALQALPPLDIILVSHNHYDHLDAPTFRALRKLYRNRASPHIITPLGNDRTLQPLFPAAKITTLDWYQFKQASPDVTIRLEPAQHWSTRSGIRRNQALWGTFVIQTPHGAIVFIGDTGYSPTIFKTIGKKHAPVRLSIIPIGAYEPRWFMTPDHVNPAEAVQIHYDLQSALSLASHYHTFPLADEAYARPEEDLALALKESQAKPQSFRTLSAGEFIQLA